jgi:hypothetical protein
VRSWQEMQEQMSKQPRSYTGHYLAPLLKELRAELLAAPAPKTQGFHHLNCQTEAAE